MLKSVQCSHLVLEVGYWLLATGGGFLVNFKSFDRNCTMALQATMLLNWHYFVVKLGSCSSLLKSSKFNSIQKKRSRADAIIQMHPPPTPQLFKAGRRLVFTLFQLRNYMRNIFMTFWMNFHLTFQLSFQISFQMMFQMSFQNNFPNDSCLISNF